MTNPPSSPITSDRPSSPYTAARRKIANQLAIDPYAYSADGRVFTYETPLAQSIPAGEFVEIRTDRHIYLGQVLDAEIVEREGPEFTLQGDAGLNVSIESVQVTQTSVRMRFRNVVGHGNLLARMHGEEALETGGADTFDDAAISRAQVSTVASYIASHSGTGTQLPIGHLAGFADNAPVASLRAKGFGRHSFLVGQSGSGKTYSLGVMLERILAETDLRIVIIDPNSDYVRLGDLRSQIDPSLQSGTERYRRAASEIRVMRPRDRTTAPGDVLKLRFSDLSPRVQGLVLQIDPIADREEYEAYWSIVRQMGLKHFSLRDLQDAAGKNLSAGSRQIALRIANLGVSDWGIWAENGEPSIADVGDDWRCLVFDIGGLEHAEEKSLVANGLLGWLWHKKDERIPTLIVIDEAHNICPQEPDDPIQAMATRRAISIAAEGRKYGLYLLLSTQRPSKIHINVLSQCDNLILMRMNSSEDIRTLAEVFSFVPRPLLDRSTTFVQGETLVAGQITPVPLLAHFGHRYSQEGGSDVPSTWTQPQVRT
ncbi:MAG TPA: ATP-binding protein [Thermomicrobiales bacterium]|nr:ATP-binding protein [Thermomicrobiales bacterium]